MLRSEIPIDKEHKVQQEPQEVHRVHLHQNSAQLQARVLAAVQVQAEAVLHVAVPEVPVPVVQAEERVQAIIRDPEIQTVPPV